MTTRFENSLMTYLAGFQENAKKTTERHKRAYLLEIETRLYRLFPAGYLRIVT